MSLIVIIGKSVPSLDIPEKINGTAKYGIDVFVPNMVEYSLDREIIDPPGKVFRYSNEDSMLLGEILKNATGLSVQEYANQKTISRSHDELYKKSEHQR